ncbi:MAG TPA: Flp family type IVb pilin [Xanthobacteraceae bacterium]|nr:Flp family type IVb pilin [Xanthobacteraceae bacterium]
MGQLFRRFARDRSGAGAITYGLIAAGISMAMVTALQGIGARLVARLD